MALNLNNPPSATPARQLTKEDWENIAAELSANAAEIFPALYPEGRIENGELRIANMQGGAPRKHGSAVIDLSGRWAGYGKDFGAATHGGGPVWVVAQRTGLGGAALYAECCRLLGRDPAVARPAHKPNGAASHTALTTAANHIPTSSPTSTNGHDPTAPTHAMPTTAEKNLARAAAIWRAAIPIAGTLAETYLRARGLTPPQPLRRQGDELRFHSHCPDGTQHGTKPALVVRWRDPATGEPTGGIHRTLLKDDGSWHIGSTGKFGPKLSLGPSQGICALGPLGDSVAIGEGIETTLAGCQLLGLGEDWTPCWGGTGAMARLADALAQPGGIFYARARARTRALDKPNIASPSDIPKNPMRRLLVLVDRGADGEAAADRLIASALAAGVETYRALPAGSDDFADDLLAGRQPPSPVPMRSEDVARPAEAGPTASAADSRQRRVGSPPTSLGELIPWFNARYAVINEAGRAVIYEEGYDQIRQRSILNRVSFEDLKKFYQNHIIEMMIGDKIIRKAAGDLWLNNKNRRQYLGGVTFSPNGDADPDQWNLWRGFTVEPRKGDWSLMRDHIRRTICGGDPDCYAYLTGWIARMFQVPHKPGDIAVILRGEKGSGKGVLCNWLVKAWGQHGIHITNPRHLIGNFNAHLRDAVLLFADEAFYAGDRQHESVLKGLITEPTLPIEGKYQNLVEVTNMLHVIMASNSDWVVPASNKERRYFVIDVGDNRVGDKKYFNAIYEQMEHGGLAAMIHYFLDYDIKDFDHRDFPETEALKQQKEHSLDTIDRWWMHVLERGHVLVSKYGATEFHHWMQWVSTDLLLSSYQQWCGNNRIHYLSSKEVLGKRFSSMYERSRPSGSEIVGEVQSLAPGADPIMRRSRPWGYRLGPLDAAAEAFGAVRGVHVAIEDGDGG
jgi:hypothetical protein